MSCSGSPRLLEAGREERGDRNISAGPSLALDNSLGCCQSQDLAKGTFSLIQHRHSHTHIYFPFTCLVDRSKHWSGLLGKEEVNLAHLVHKMDIFPDHLKGKHKVLSCRRTKDCWRIWNYFLERRLQDKVTGVTLDKIILSSQCFYTKEILKLKNPGRSLILL